MLQAPLDVHNEVAGLALIPPPIKVFSDGAKLNDQIVGEVFRFNFAALLPPQPDQHCFVGPHDDAGIGAADKGAAVFKVKPEEMGRG
jgi:hypothetical protein